ncbi:hypothetical protein BKA62DRAFT_826688 [Auriculariales sp. MPI-PUGE-AT-0066]|nr:hypothetical protein BKA62DRAFT_826688 [Auriculariales sp. MPI-PUGE-AT-0066]
MEARAREVPEVVPYVPLADPRPDFIKSLPDLTTEDVSLDDNCPICLISFETILKEAAASALDVHAAISNPSNPKAAWYNGVTKLDRCGHVFCKQDLVEWIQGSHGSCPTCRDQFLTLAIEEGYESSDGGEYIPPSDDTMDADDIELDGEATSDSFTDDMDMSDWGQTSTASRAP